MLNTYVKRPLPVCGDVVSVAIVYKLDLSVGGVQTEHLGAVVLAILAKPCYTCHTFTHMHIGSLSASLYTVHSLCGIKTVNAGLVSALNHPCIYLGEQRREEPGHGSGC